MRVLYINHDAASNGLLGSNVALYNLIKSFKDEMEIAMVFPSEGVLVDKCREMGVKFYVLYAYRMSVYPSTPTLKRKIKYPLTLLNTIRRRYIAIWNLSKIVEEFKPDIIHTNVGPQDIGHIVAKKYGIPHVWHIREYQDKDFGTKPFPSMAAFREHLHEPNNHLISITKDIFRYFEMSEEKDRVIYDGVFNKKEINIKKEKKPYFLFAGSMSEAKGVDILLRAYAAYTRQGGTYALKIAAAWSELYGPVLKDIVREEGLDYRVEFLGYRKDVYEWMSEASAEIVASRFEGFGFITAEAMYNNCLVIGHNTAGTKEQFDNGLEYTGKEIGLRYDTEKELTGYLLAVERNGQEYYADMIERAFQMVNTHYTNQIYAANVKKFYEHILSTRKSL